jgi:multidrug efflux system membrane fusion protein
MKRITLVLAAICAVSVFSKDGVSSGGGGKGNGRGATPFPVEVAAVATRNSQRAVNAVGSTEAFELVQVTARVQGAVEKVLFREGDAVRAGDSLVEIEPSRFRVAVNAARRSSTRRWPRRREPKRASSAAPR